MHAASSLVAIVDDEESVRRALGRLLRSTGFDVQTFASGADFLHSLERSSPQCVVLDLRMPQMNGFEVLSALARAGASVPVVIITGDDSADSRQLALGRGATAYLRKPVDESMLLDAIQNAMTSPPAGVANQNRP
jgi:FixJ family two-component response regulator